METQHTEEIEFTEHEQTYSEADNGAHSDEYVDGYVQDDGKVITRRNNRDYLTTSEVAKLLGCNKAIVLSLIKEFPPILAPYVKPRGNRNAISPGEGVEVFKKLYKMKYTDRYSQEQILTIFESELSQIAISDDPIELKLQNMLQATNKEMLRCVIQEMSAFMEKLDKKDEIINNYANAIQKLQVETSHILEEKNAIIHEKEKELLKLSVQINSDKEHNDYILKQLNDQNKEANDTISKLMADYDALAREKMEVELEKAKLETKFLSKSQKNGLFSIFSSKKSND